MKKSIIYIMALFIFGAGHAQFMPDLPFDANSQQGSVRAGTEVFLVDSIHVYLFTGSNDDSLLYGKEYLSYTPHGNVLTDSTLGFLADSNQWLYVSKRIFAYDEINRVEHRTEYIGNFLNNSWLKHWDYHHSYLGNSGRKSLTLTRHFDQMLQSWEREDSIVFLYDAQDWLEFEYQHQWINDSNNYITKDHRHYAYNGQGWCISDTLYYYLTGDSAIPTFLRIYEYDNNGNEIEYRSYDGWGGIWSEMEKHEKTFNSFNQQVRDERYEWDPAANDWDWIELGLINYNDDQNMHLWRYFEKNETSGAWEKENTAQFFWSLHTVVGIPEAVEEEGIRFWPNPAMRYIAIDSPRQADIRIFNMLGKLCLRQRIPAGRSALNLESLAPGSYIIRSMEEGSGQVLLVR